VKDSYIIVDVCLLRIVIANKKLKYIIYLLNVPKGILSSAKYDIKDLNFSFIDSTFSLKKAKYINCISFL